MRRFYRAYEVVRRLNAWSTGLACVFIMLMIGFTDWESFTRYFLRDPAMWTYPITSYLLLYSTYLAMGYTLQRGGHVRVEFVVELLPRAVQRWLDRLGHLAGLTFTLLFLVQSWRLFTRALVENQRDISTLSVPMGLVILALPLGLGLMAITYLFVLVDSFLHSADSATLQERERSGTTPDQQLE